MPGSFDNPLTIDEHEYLLPTGRLGARPGETVLRLHAWLLQPGGVWTAFLLGPFGRKVSVEARLVIACGPKLEGRHPHAPAIFSEAFPFPLSYLAEPIIPTC